MILQTLTAIIILLILFAFLAYSSKKKNTNIENKYIIYNFIAEQVSLKPMIDRPASYITAHYYYPRSIAIGLLQIPKTLVSTIFLIDIFFFNSLNYFFISLNLFIPLLVTRSLCFMVEHYTSRQLTYLQQYMSFTPTVDGGVKIDLKLPDEVPLNNNSSLAVIINEFKTMCDDWYFYSPINKYTTDIKATFDFYKKYFQLYGFLCYLIGWISLFYL